jgi:DNA-binding transcriptional MerR regulator
MISERIENKTFLSKTAGSFSGVPQRTVQRWTELGLLKVPTSGTGDRRKYTVLNCIEIGILKSLSNERMWTFLMKGLMETLRETRRFRDNKPPLQTKKTHLEEYLEKGSGFVHLIFSINGLMNFSVQDQARSYQFYEGIYTGEPYGEIEKILIINLVSIAKKVLEAMK